jgi:hypothetical protein
MEKMFLNTVLFILLLSCCFFSCSDNSELREVTYYNNINDDTNLNSDLQSSRTINSEDELTITVPIQEHEFHMTRENGEQHRVNLSAENVKDLESWWDSLPSPVQSQIKANEIDIEVVSNIRTHNQNDINPQLNDSQIENTGETLEQIIGFETGMKYTVSTMLIDNAEQSDTNNGQHATNIRLVKRVPVKLQQFKADIFLRKNEVSNENIRTLQYWWTSLPEDIRSKIKNQEVVLDISCHTILDIDIDNDNSLSGALAKEYAEIINDVLSRMIGVYKINNKEFPLANIRTFTKFDKTNAKNLNFPSKQFINISLHKNKTFVKNPI